MIRHATEHDLDTVLHLLKEYDDSLDEVQGDRAPIEVLAKAIVFGIANHDPILLAVDGDRVQGMVAWANMPEADANLIHGLMLYVRPEFRRMGIARSLAARAEQVSRDKGYRRYTCEVAAENEAGLAAIRSRPGARLTGYTFVRELEEVQWQSLQS